MGLWDTIKRFFSGEKNGKDLKANDRGDLEVTVETVSASDDDLSVELFEISEDTEFVPEEDPDIEVEIVVSEEDDLSVLPELDPMDRASGIGSCRENTEACGEKTAESPSRMTEEYKQWLREQEALRDQPDRTTES